MMMMDPSAMKQKVDRDAMVAEQNWALMYHKVAQKVVQKKSFVEVGLVALLHYHLVLGMDFGMDLQRCWVQNLYMPPEGENGCEDGTAAHEAEID